MNFTSVGGIVWEPSVQPVYPFVMDIDPGQSMDMTDSGAMVVETTGAQEVVIFTVQFFRLPGDSLNELLSYMRNVVNWSADAFYFFDNVTSYTVRYIDSTFKVSLDNIDQYSAQLSLREVIV